MAPRETENNAYAKFGVTYKEHYGMLWYFLEWSLLHNLCFSFLLGITAVQREIENNAYAKFWAQLR